MRGFMGFNYSTNKKTLNLSETICSIFYKIIQ